MRTVNPRSLLHVAAGRMGCKLLARFLKHLQNRVSAPLTLRIKQHYSIHIFRSMARLDFPTFDDPCVIEQLESAWSTRSGNSTVAWDVITTTCRCMSTLSQLVSQTSVLVGVLSGQKDGSLLAILSFSHAIMDWISRGGGAKPGKHNLLVARVSTDSQCP
jgi:hypothetical protein